MAVVGKFSFKTPTDVWDVNAMHKEQRNTEKIPLKCECDFRIRAKNVKFLFIENHILPIVYAEYRFKWDQNS